MNGTILALAVLALPAQEEYFPLAKGMRWTYETHAGKPFVKRVLGFQDVRGTRCAIVQFGDTQQHWVSAGKDGVRVHRSRGVTFERPLLLFRFPLTKGDRWTGKAESDRGEIAYRFEGAGEEKVEVPAGTFTAFRVDWTMTQGSATTKGRTWLARGMGAIKETFGRSSLSLVKLERPQEARYPLAKGKEWIFRTDYDKETRIVHAVTGVEKVGEVECFVVERQSRAPYFPKPRVLGKEWLAVTDKGVVVHKIRRGRTDYAVVKPFFKLKNRLVIEDEWGGETRGDEIPPKYQYWVEGQEDVKVPAGEYRAWKLRYKVQSGPHVAQGFEWWVKNVGLVKYELNLSTAGFSMTAELEKVAVVKEKPEEKD